MNTKLLAITSFVAVAGAILALSKASDTPTRVLITSDDCTIYFGGFDVEEGLRVHRIGSLRVVATKSSVLSLQCRFLRNDGLVLAQGAEKAPDASTKDLVLPPMRPAHTLDISPNVQMELIVVLADGQRTWTRSLLESDAN